MKKRVINMSVLHGEPTDGSGRLCIHLVVPDSHGPFTEPQVLQMDKVKQMHGEMALFTGPKQCRLACDSTRKRQVKPIDHKGVTKITMRTGDPRATTCPRCIASEEYTRIMKVITNAAQGAPTEQES